MTDLHTLVTRFLATAEGLYQAALGQRGVVIIEWVFLFFVALVAGWTMWITGAAMQKAAAQTSDVPPITLIASFVIAALFLLFGGFGLLFQTHDVLTSLFNPTWFAAEQLLGAARCGQ